MKLGLTGGIASGKSTVSAMLVRLGAKLVDADQVAREVVLPGEPALMQLSKQFGQEIVKPDGSLDRQALGRIVFTPDKQKLKELEAILHPAIRERMHKQMDAYLAEEPDRLVIADIPLLFETGQESLYDAVLLVYVPKATQLERLMAREGMTSDEAKVRIELQMDMEEKKQRADYIIDNSSTLEHTQRQIEKIWRELGYT